MPRVSVGKSARPVAAARRQRTPITTQEKLLSLGEVASLCEAMTGRRPSPSTITRWCLHGTRKCRLAYQRVGSRYFFRRAAVLEFLASLDSNAEPPLTVDNARHAITVATILGRPWGGEKGGEK